MITNYHAVFISFTFAGDTTVSSAEANANPTAELPSPPVNVSENLQTAPIPDLAPCDAECAAEVSVDVSINNNKPAPVDTNSLPAADVAKDQNLESSEVVVRKQKNRIMCQCGSAICRKYLF